MPAGRQHAVTVRRDLRGYRHQVTPNEHRFMLVITRAKASWGLQARVHNHRSRIALESR
jgi:hypothetical protein